MPMLRKIELYQQSAQKKAVLIWIELYQQSALKKAVLICAPTLVPRLKFTAIKGPKMESLGLDSI